MNEGEMLLIKVPASTANLGPGFDSIGLALNLYLTLEVARSECWEVIPLTEELKEFPNDESNFIIRTAIEVAKTFETILAPCQIKVDSNIPLARGLGSSASAIVAGIELADQVGNLQLTKQQKFEIASKMEGHPDNVGASIFGGLVIGCQIGEEVDAEIIHSRRRALNEIIAGSIAKLSFFWRSCFSRCRLQFASCSSVNRQFKACRQDDETGQVPSTISKRACSTFANNGGTGL